MTDNFLKYLEFEKRYSAHTIRAYEKDLEQLLTFIKSEFDIEDLQKADHSHLRSWIVSLMNASSSPNSVNRKIACLKSFYKYLMVRYDAEDNPAARLKPLKTDKKLPVFAQEGEMNQLLDQIPFEDSFSGARDKLILELLYATGIRLSELIGLKDQDINFYDSTIKVLGKRNKERVIPIPQNIVNTLKEYLIKREDLNTIGNQELLLTDQKQPLYPMFVYRTVKHYLGVVTTLTKRSPHVLRHTFATHLLDKGADLNAVKDLLGHTSLAATQVYTHNTLEKLKSAFDTAHPKA